MKISKELEQEYEKRFFAPEQFAMLHTKVTMQGGEPHPDRGRIGQIVSADEGRIPVVEMFSGDEKSTFLLLPRDHWLPFPEFLVEEYQHESKGRGWRPTKRGLEIAGTMGWELTDATLGKA